MNPANIPSGKEVSFGEDEIIVSKTDLNGVITYANDVFLRIVGYTEAEILGKPHNIIRHPAMPRCVFYLLWNVIKGGNEIFAYVLNMAKNGDSYWVFAHVTPSYDKNGKMTGYHSNRRVPHPDALDKVRPLYATLVSEEKKHATTNEGMKASFALVENLLKDNNLSYGEFVFSLSKHTHLENSVR